jgi:8-oxo-dGTP diphosphatase
LPPITHRYTNFTVTLYSYICKIAGGEICLHEHAASCWLRPEDLPNLDWAEADWVLIENSRKEIHLCFGDLD